MALTADQLNTIYQNVLFRNVDTAGIQFFANRTDISDAQVRQQIELSQEASTFVSPVVRLYQEVLGRVPDAAGLKFFSNQLRAGTSLDAVAQQLVSSAEFSAKSTAVSGAVDATDLSNTNQLVTDAFQSILGRTPASGEFAFFQGKTAAQILSLVAGSPEAASTNAAGVVTFLDSVAQGAYPTGTLNNQTGGATGGTNVGTIYTLTNSVDNFTGTAKDDTFNAVVSSTTGATTLTGLDKIDGGAGTDTFNITDTATAAAGFLNLPGGLSVTNVEKLNLTTSGNVSGGVDNTSAFDISGFTGLTSATIVAAGSGGSNVKVADTTSLSLTQAGGIATVQGGLVDTIVNGGTGATTVTGAALTNVSVKGGGAVTIDNTNSSGTTSVGTTLTSVTLDTVDAASALKGAALTNLTLTGATTAARTVTITNGTANHALNLTVNGTGYKADGSAVASVVVDAAATSLAINATGSKSAVSLAGDTLLKTVTTTGSAALALNLDGTSNTAVTKFDGSAATGNLTLTNVSASTTAVSTGSGNDSFTLLGTSKLTVSAGAGNDTVTLGSAVAAGSTIGLGDGNDVLLFASGGSVAASTTGNATVIDGGAGFDTVSSALINAGNAAQFTNFEGLSLQGSTTLDVSLLTGSTITALTIDAASSGTYSNVKVAQSLTDNFVGDNSGNTTTLNFADATGTSDTYTINFNGAAQTSAASAANVKLGTIAAAGIENFNIVSGGGTNTYNSMTLGADAAAQKVVITGSQNLDLAFASGFGSTSNGNTGVSLIDGSGATGKLSINEANITAAASGLTVRGGSAADTLTTAAFASTLTGNAGADNFVVAATTYASATTFTTITDASSTDKITFVDKGTETFQTAKVDVSAATTLQSALGIATNGVDGSTNGAIKWFQYGGNTYVVEAIANAAAHTGTDAASADVVVKLTGLVDLSTAAGAGTNVLTLA